MGRFAWICKICKGKEDREVECYNSRVNAELQARWKKKGHEIAVKELLRENIRERKDGEEQGLSPCDYIVFIDIAGDIDWIYCDENVREKLSARSSSLISRATAIESFPCRYIGDEWLMAFKKTLGFSIVLALDRRFNDAELLMRRAQEFLLNRTAEISRLWVLIISLLILVLASSACICLSYYAPEKDVNPFLFGLIGAFIAIARKNGQQYRDAGAGFLLHAIDTLVRMIVGMLLGWVGVLLLKSPFAPETLKGICGSVAGVRIVAFAAGLFEYFVPTMISRCVVTPFKPQEEIT